MPNIERISFSNYKFWAESKAGWVMVYKRTETEKGKEIIAARFQISDGDYIDVKAVDGYIDETSLEDFDI